MSKTPPSSSLLAYERLRPDLHLLIETCEGERVIQRQPFNWLKDGILICNGVEGQSMEHICEERGWQIVEKYGEHLGIIIEND